MRLVWENQIHRGLVQECFHDNLDQYMRFWYLSHRRSVNAHCSGKPVHQSSLTRAYTAHTHKEGKLIMVQIN